MQFEFDVTSVFALVFAGELSRTQTLRIICCEFVTSTFLSHSHSQEAWTELNPTTLRLILDFSVYFWFWWPWWGGRGNRPTTPTVLLKLWGSFHYRCFALSLLGDDSGTNLIVQEVHHPMVHVDSDIVVVICLFILVILFFAKPSATNQCSSRSTWFALSWEKNPLNSITVHVSLIFNNLQFYF